MGTVGSDDRATVKLQTVKLQLFVDFTISCSWSYWTVDESCTVECWHHRTLNPKVKWRVL